MKRAIIIFLVTGVTIAQAAVYNFNFYNEGSLAAGPGAPIMPQQQQKIPMLAERPIEKEKDDKASFFGFEFGYGLRGYSDSASEKLDGNNSASFNLAFSFSDNAKIKLGFIHERLGSGFSASKAALMGGSLALSVSTKVIGPLALTTELEGQISVGELGAVDLTKKYGGVSVGPQLNLGKHMHLNLLGKVGYQDIKDGAGNDYGSGLSYGAQLNLGFTI